MSIITLQCGNYANYVGAHFWNMQEFEFEYSNDNRQTKLHTVDHDILYREGLTLDRQVTYTPRLVSIDLKGSLGSLPELGDLYHKNTVPKLESLNWGGDTAVMKEEPHKRNQFYRDMQGDDDEDSEKESDDVSGTETETKGRGLYNLDNEVHYWSDYLFARYHPKSVLVMDSFQHMDTTHPFDIFGLGQSVWSDQHQDVGDQIDDRIRYFAEECDSLQGFHLISDSGSAFGGLAAKIHDLLCDDYSSKSVLNVPVSPPTLDEYKFTSCGSRLANSTLSISRLLDGGLVTPLSLASDWFPLHGRTTALKNIDYNPDLLYHSSAILASVLDTITLVYRQKEKMAALSDVISSLSRGKRSVAAVSTLLPLDVSEVQMFEKDIFTKLTPLLPSTSGFTDQNPRDKYQALLTLRGLLGSNIYSRRSGEYRGAGAPEEYLEYCASQQLQGCSARMLCHAKPLQTIKPFPHVFARNISSDGYNTGFDRPVGEGVNMVPMLTSWNSGPSAAASMTNLGNKSAKLTYGKLPRFLDCGTEQDEWTEAVERIQALAENYTDDDI